MDSDAAAWASLAAICGAMVLGAMSPGPSFLYVARTSAARSRRHGVAAAFGMGAGAVVFGLLALAGLIAAIRAVPWLYLVLRVAGGAYLVYVAVRVWRSARTSLAMDDPGIEGASAGGASGDAGNGGGAKARNVGKRVHASAGRGGVLQSFRQALLIQLSNPKTAVVYATVFAALLPQSPPFWMLAALLPVLFAIEAGWYILVAGALSAPRPRAAYARWKAWVDRAAAGVLGVLGARLAGDAAREAIGK